ncbi:MAG TPA: PAS domain S-box protein [archaeon]|nr:PAS domain S-box protein [archaeon]
MHKIMIVEDEVIIAIQLEDRLKARGYDVVGFAKTGEEAVKMAGSLKPDLILMDIVMPGKLDGVDTATRIKKEQNIPVVFLTAFADDTLIKRAKEAEPYGYIIKPYREKEIIAVVELALNKIDLERKLAKEELKKYGDRLEKLVERRTARLIKTNERLEREIKERKRAEEELKKSEALYRAISGLVTSLAYSISVESAGKFGPEWVSGEYQKITGYTLEEVATGGGWESIVYPEDMPVVKARRARLLSGESDISEFRILTKKGEIRWLRDYSLSFWNASHSRVVRIIGAAQDITERKKAEEALRESEERFRVLADSTFEGILIHEKGKVLDTNRTFATTFGYEQSELTGMDALKLVTPESRELVRKNINNEYEKPYEAVGLRKDGSSFIMEINASSFQYKNRRVRVAAYRDITERKLAEEALRESEGLLRRVIETAPPCIYVKDRNGKYLLVDKQTADLHGVTSEAMVGKTDLDFLHMAITTSKEVEVFLADDREVIDSKQKKLIPAESFTLSDGTVRWFETVKVPLSLRGNPDCVLGVGIDITERKRAEEEIRRLNQFQESIIDNANVWFNVLDENGNIVIWNKAAEEISGYSRDEVLGHAKIWEWLYPEKEYRKKIFEKALEIINEQTVVENFETRIRSKNGEYKIISWHSRNLVDNAGKPIGSIALGRNVSKLKQAEEKLRKSREELSELAAYLQNIREEERKIISREIHDELGQALTAMKIDLSLLRDNIPIRQTELVSKTETISRLLDTTISTVKRISSDLRPGLLDDLGLVPAIEWQVAEFVKRTGIEFKLSLPEKELAINQDLSTALFRILQEALTNITRHARATKVVISLKEKNGAVQLIVNDNGIGIGEKEALASSSLGLIGMRERVRSFDGEFDIKSEMSQGTTLEITIPLKR